ncbi:hypothetical protein POX_b02199 [Penicillium oxalicum]|uniref:hypothetical protein n=1 Tax=Penicillium oxalicum TaxID=69781 RepID=UPI0020B7E679|nr:hypothetical protein POX_b02199 [Penicillium oxalicum]KAI2792162.1 hypothetical protein POX_b02199 [Penicillium oxalicum]
MDSFTATELGSSSILELSFFAPVDSLASFFRPPSSGRLRRPAPTKDLEQGGLVQVYPGFQSFSTPVHATKEMFLSKWSSSSVTSFPSNQGNGAPTDMI